MQRLAVVLSLAMLASCGSDVWTGDDGPSVDSNPDPNSNAHPRILLPSARARLLADLETPAGRRFVEVVDRWLDGHEYDGFQAWNAALLGQLTGDGKYCTAAIAEIDKQVDAANTRMAAGDPPAVAHDSYLSIGDLVGDLALVYDWCHDRLQDRGPVWLAYANQAVWNVWHPAAATWSGRPAPWSGWGTDNPSNNYHYSFLRATMLLGLAARGDSPQADDWLTEFRDRRILDTLVPVFESDLTGGGSREGTGYGVSMRRLFELYDLWHASTGEQLATRTAHTRASLLAFLHQTLPTRDRVAPTGDHARDSTAAFFDYHRHYLQQLIALFPDEPAAGAAQTLIDTSSVTEMATQFMFVHDYFARPVAPKRLDELATAYHARGIGQLYARASWAPDAMWLNLTAGPYTESHAHQDQGALMIFKGGWLVHDANVESASGIHQETDAHSLVRLVDTGGVSIEQRRNTTSALVALHRGPGWLHAAADVSAAYKHAATDVQRVHRELVFLEPDTVVVYDRVTTSARAQHVWQLVTPTTPTLHPGTTRIATLGTLDVYRIVPTNTPSTVRSLSTLGDFAAGARLETWVPGGDRRYLHVLADASAITAVTPINSDDTADTADTANSDGVRISLADGRTATITFARDAIGGTLVLDGSTTTLTATVDDLPE